MKLLRNIIITVLTGGGAAVLFASNAHFFTSALPAKITTHYLRQREGNNNQSQSRSLKQDDAGSGNNGSGIGNGGVNSMKYIATVQGVKKDGTKIFMIVLGDTVAAAKAVGNEELVLLGAKPIGKGNNKKRALYKLWGFTLPVDEAPGIRNVYDFTDPNKSGEVEAAMDMWNNVKTSDFVYNLKGKEQGITPGSACYDGPYDNTKTISDGDLGKRRGRNGIVLGMCCARGDVNSEGVLVKGDVDIINNNNRDLDRFWGLNDRYRTVTLHELGHGFGLAHSAEEAVMASYHSDSIKTPQCDDIAGITALYPKEEGITVDCGGGNTGGGGGECPICSGESSPCCAPGSCKGQPGNKKCKGG